uniref:Calpain catalytic domain-containing protein n=1 Tax=Mesocestoides corti TaxID=53468 RepID=A0A5K3FJX1_MESCO
WCLNVAITASERLGCFLGPRRRLPALSPPPPACNHHSRDPEWENFVNGGEDWGDRRVIPSRYLPQT